MRHRPRALALARAVHRARIGASLARTVDAQRAPAIALDRVGRELKGAPALRILVVALLLATSAHAMAGAFGLGLRAKKAKGSRVAMAVAPPEEDPEQDEAPPEPEPAPSRSGAAVPAAAAAPSLAAPGPLFAGLSAAAGVGAGGEGAMAVGGGGASGGEDTAETRRDEPTEPVPPRVLRRTPPQYPKAARARGTTGRVVLQLLVDERGRVAEVRVLTSDPPGIFDEAATAAARGWLFEPGRDGDTRVQAWVRQTIRFELE